MTWSHADNMWPTEGLSFGADYNPEQWDRSVWREDMKLMLEAGVNGMLGLAAVFGVEVGAQRFVAGAVGAIGFGLRGAVDLGLAKLLLGDQLAIAV